MIRQLLPACFLALAASLAAPARAVSSAELYQNQSYTYGRFEARIRFAAGDGVVSSFFLWKPGSEMAGAFWNELDFEKLGADCRLQTNPLYGMPVADHGQIASVSGVLCDAYHTYTFEWTPSYIAWQLDGVEIRREEGDTAAAFAQNAASGMQMHFNIWPGDATFGGNFDPAILPVRQYISWVQYSSFEDGTFVPQWREEFTAGALPSGWAAGNWASPKNYSTHATANLSFTSGIAVLSLTADGAPGFEGEPPPDGAVDSGPEPAAGGSASADAGEPGGADGAELPGGAGAGELPAGSGSNGMAGMAAMSSAAGSSAGGAAPTSGAAGRAPALSGAASRARGGGGCALQTSGGGSAGRFSALLFAASVFLAARRKRRPASRGCAASGPR